MSVFEGKAWISKQGLVDVSIEVENGYISSVKKTSLEPKKEKAKKNFNLKNYFIIKIFTFDYSFQSWEN